MYKLVILDIDGTLLNPKGMITAKTMSAIRKARQQGVVVTLCTGRNIRKTIPVAKKAEVNTPFACIDGTLLFDPVHSRVVEELCLSKKELDYILDIAVNKDMLVEVTDGYHYFKYARDESLYKYDIFNKRTFSGRIKSFLGGVRYTKGLEDLRLVKAPVYQVILSGSRETIAGVKDTVLAHTDERIEARDHLWDNCVFISRKGVKKALGMESLCRYFDVSMEETIAIGDDLNDIDMLEKAGLGIAMGNANDRVKAVADYITLSNQEDGVAAAIERFIVG